MPVHHVETSRLPTQWAEFDMHGFEDTDADKEHLVLTLGDVSNGEPVLVRVHSECLTGDAVFSMCCDGGDDNASPPAGSQSPVFSDDPASTSDPNAGS